MSRQKRQGLKLLLETVPTGFIIDAKWLRSNSISRQLVSRYVESGWLERIAHGVYRRPDQDTKQGSDCYLDWETVVLSFQHIMRYSIHVGGLTALEQQGYMHFVTMEERERCVFLYGQEMPTWLESIQTQVIFQIRKRKLFKEVYVGVERQASLDGKPDSSFPWGWAMSMSTAERGILEAIDELTSEVGFRRIDLIFQSLANLRPRLMTKLLLSCTSKKVKRLFLAFADRHAHSWRKYIDDKQIDIGSGDRALVKAGKLHPRYRIMVPEWFLKDKGREME